MSAVSLQDNEIYLGGYRLPIKGRVQVVKATQHPGKVTIGQTKRADQVLADEWVQDDWQDGLLIEHLDETIHKGRFYWATVDTTRRRKMMLSPRVVNLGSATNPKTKCSYLLEFNDQVIGFWNGVAYAWNEGGATWGSPLHDIGTTPLDHVVFQGKLYLAKGNSYYIYSPTDTVPWQEYFEPISYLTIFDVSPTQKIVAIDNTGLVKVSTDGLSWDSTSVGGKIDNALPRDLLPFRSPDDEPILVAATNYGLYTIDTTTKKAYPTSLSLTRDDNAGRGCLVWSDGNLYFPNTLALWRYPHVGQITNVGLDREDGLPIFVRGLITRLVNTPSYIVAVVDASKLKDTEPEGFFFGMEWGVSHIPKANRAGFSSLLLFNGAGWHTLYLSNEASTGIHAALLTSIYNSERRLFFADSLDVKYVWLREGNYDPSQDPTATFQEKGEFETSWFDAGYSEITKLAISVKMRALGITDEEIIDVYYALNNKPNYYYLGTVNAKTIDSAGRAIFKFDYPQGIHFYTIKLKFVFGRGADPHKTPVLLFFDLRYKLMPQPLWGWTFTIVGNDYAHLQDIWQVLKGLAEDKHTVEFAFRGEEESTHAVEIVGLSGVRYAAGESTSYFTCTVVELES